MLMNLNLNKSFVQDQMTAEHLQASSTPSLQFNQHGNVIMADHPQQVDQSKMMIQLIGIIGEQNNGVGWNGDETLREQTEENKSIKRDGESVFDTYVNKETGMRETGSISIPKDGAKTPNDFERKSVNTASKKDSDKHTSEVKPASALKQTTPDKNQNEPKLKSQFSKQTVLHPSA